MVVVNCHEAPMFVVCSGGCSCWMTVNLISSNLTAIPGRYAKLPSKVERYTLT